MNKRMVVVIAVVFVILSVVAAFLFFGPSDIIIKVSKVPVTANYFATLLQADGYVLNDITPMLSEYDFLSKAYIFNDKEFNYSIEFYEFLDTNSAREFYDDNKNIFLGQKLSDSIENSVAKDNYERYELIVGPEYMLICVVGNTVAISKTTTSFENVVNGALAKINY